MNINSNYDLIVIGGGLTGVAAAVAAAREESKVLLIERYGFLGGAATNCLVNPFMNYFTSNKTKDNNKKILSKGIFLEILKNLNDLDGLDENNVTFNEEILKLVLDRMIRENKVDVLFHSYLIDVNKQDDQLLSVVAANKSGKQEYIAKYFLDCTGDADLAALSGCSYQLGRIKDNLCQPMTLCFRISNIDKDKFREVKHELSKIYQKFQLEGKIKNPRENVLLFHHVSPGVLHFNSTRIIKRNPINSADLSIAEMEAREQVYELFLFLKNNILGFENSKLLMSAPQIGVRESRMIDGEYKITVEDLLSCKKFEDSIACGAYGVDIHSPDGTGTTLKYIPEGEYYTIPYRALIPKGTSNLLVAGRCISSTHEAQSAYRILPICCCIGEAAGLAMSLAIKEKVPCNSISIEKLHELIDKYGGLWK